MKVNIGIQQTHLKKIGEFLNQLLADEFVLYTKLRNYHWNLTGDNFLELHQLYESQYKQIEQVIDEIAERGRILGQIADGNLRTFLDKAALKESKPLSNQKEQLKHLVADHETLLRHLRENNVKFEEEYKDMVTKDFLTSIMGMHEKMAWMLRMYID